MNDLKIIRKNYGENMMHLCRALFPTILETPGLLSDLMLSKFAPSKFLHDDIISNGLINDFKNYIYSFIDLEEKKMIVVDKTPHELLSEAGYDLYECRTEEEIQSFRKYYAPREALCTFNGGRLDRCYVFFAVKKNVKDIKRENFPNPERQDEYGTSVISIQFTKGTTNTLSIKNRYNHTVQNPDSTFGNNLDNIIEGLTESFIRTYDLNTDSTKSKFELPGYVKANDGKYYKYNYEINNVYYCPGNIIIDNFEVINKYSDKPERYIVLDYFIIDTKEKTIELYDKTINDSFIQEFNNIEKISITLDKETNNKTIEIIYDGGKKAILIINNKNQLVEYHNDFIETMNNAHLKIAKYLTCFKAEKLITMGARCLYDVSNLRIMETPNLIKMGNGCLYNCPKLTKLNISNLKEMGGSCINYAYELKEFEAPNLKKMEMYCLIATPNLTTFKAPNLIKIEDNSLKNCDSLTILEVPNLIEIGDSCLYKLPSLTIFEAPNLKKIGNGCLAITSQLTTFKAPNLVEIGNNFLKEAVKLEELELPNLIKLGNYSLQRAYNLKIFKAPNLIELSDWTLNEAYKLEIFEAPNLKKIGNSCLNNTFNLKQLELENLEIIGEQSLQNTSILQRITFPKLLEIGDSTLTRTANLINIEAPNLKKVGTHSLSSSIENKADLNYYTDLEVVETKQNKKTSINKKINELIKKGTYKIKQFKEIIINTKKEGNKR